MADTKKYINWAAVFFAILLAGSFFLPWVNWEGTGIPGYAMPAGEFFSLSDKKYGLANPYPGLDILLKLFWLIPAAALVTIIAGLAGKKIALPASLAGLLALSLATIYILFSNTLLMLGVGKSLVGNLSFGIYLTILAALGLIIAVMRRNGLAATGLIIAGPLAAWIGFMIISKQLEGEKYKDSAEVVSAYTVDALDLISEFKANDSLSNAKYREQIITVKGRISEIESQDANTVNIKIADSTGSYLIFPLQDNYLAEAKTLVAGETVVIRGSCSGGIYSDILETEIITFKRCALLKQ